MNLEAERFHRTFDSSPSHLFPKRLRFLSWWCWWSMYLLLSWWLQRAPLNMDWLQVGLTFDKESLTCQLLPCLIYNVLPTHPENLLLVGCSLYLINFLSGFSEARFHFMWYLYGALYETGWMTGLWFQALLKVDILRL